MESTQYQNRLLTHISLFQTALLDWFSKVKRDLPWRQEPHLYKTVVSEFMLQQTQVVTVLPYFDRWMKSFPDFNTLAKADESVVLKHWEGLGYYQRARHLHRLAKHLVLQVHYPKTAIEWEQLPGVGPYTAAAISSIAQNQPEAVIDGNVIRILTRLSADGRLFKSSQEAYRQLKPLAQRLLAPHQPGDYNEALMELGATVCTKANPVCNACPVRVFCEAYDLNQVTAFPVLQKKTLVKRFLKRILCIHKGCILLEKYDAKAKRLANCYELPLITDHEASLVADKMPFKIKKRGIAQEIIEESIYQLSVDDLNDFYKQKEWVKITHLNDYQLSGPHRRWLQEWLA